MKILYFAWLRERMNKGQEDVAPPEAVTTIDQLIDWKAANDEGFALAFEDRAIIRASIDDELVDHDAPIANAREIAFFPPMTGG
ncbi:molybdopterin converting factor subunit 1 [Maritalea porphyrae]|uniref:molybdopterin converting factor subunit 1 n=1 Tax=Maritalea porphyrae TaxID=880732 RepID=UPI0022AF0C65|nr:molybdopterin converting factor subunit 1 [Maritalea porphyrae]MCZ4274107.1 molybdopterin converting factor subunit 1 [Maritalea porphyrae]